MNDTTTASNTHPGDDPGVAAFRAAYRAAVEAGDFEQMDKLGTQAEQSPDDRYAVAVEEEAAAITTEMEAQGLLTPMSDREAIQGRLAITYLFRAYEFLYPTDPAASLERMGNAVAGVTAQVAILQTLLNAQDTMGEFCSCSRCEAAVKEMGVAECQTCGYRGLFKAVSCQCYDRVCLGGTSRGFGCPHGSLTCPVCGDGEADFDHWSLVKEIRAHVAAILDLFGITPPALTTDPDPSAEAGPVH